MENFESAYYIYSITKSPKNTQKLIKLRLNNHKKTKITCMLLKQHTVPSPISINIKNIKNKYTQYSQLPKNKKNKFYVVKTTYSIKNNVYNLIVI